MAGLVARMAHLTTVLGVVFLISARTGSYALAGTVSAAYAVAYAAVSPRIGWSVDRHGQGQVLVPATVANAACRAGFLAAVWLGAPPWSLVALSALSGATMPSVGALVRARWSHLLGGSSLLHTAMAFESVVDEVIFVVGPVAVTTLATQVDPAAGPVMALLLATAGLVALALQRRTQPPVARPGRATGGTALGAPGFGLLLATVVATAAALSVIELTTIAFSEQHGAKAQSGQVLAVLALGSATSGLWYGVRKWSWPPERRLVAALPLLAGGTLLFVAGSSVWFLSVAAFSLGLATAPVVIAAFSTVDRSVSKGQRTEGLTWQTSAAGIGISFGNAVAGRVVDAGGTRTAFMVATGCAVVATLTGLVTAYQLRSIGSGAAGRERGPVDPAADHRLARCPD